MIKNALANYVLLINLLHYPIKTILNAFTLRVLRFYMVNFMLPQFYHKGDLSFEPITTPHLSINEQHKNRKNSLD